MAEEPIQHVFLIRVSDDVARQHFGVMNRYIYSPRV